MSIASRVHIVCCSINKAPIKLPLKKTTVCKPLALFRKTQRTSHFSQNPLKGLYSIYLRHLIRRLDTLLASEGGNLVHGTDYDIQVECPQVISPPPKTILKQHTPPLRFHFPLSFPHLEGRLEDGRTGESSNSVQHTRNPKNFQYPKHRPSPAVSINPSDTSSSAQNTI